MDYLSLGRIFDSYGIKGAVRIYSSTHFAKERYKKNRLLFLISEDGKDIKEVTVKDYRNVGNVDIVSFEEILTPEQAKTYKGYSVNINKQEASIPKDSYLFVDLQDCEVFDENGVLLGKVKKVEEFPAQITLRVKRENEKDFFVPFIDQFIKTVDIKDKKITIYLIPGML